MLTNQQHDPSSWVRRFASLIGAGGHVLDLAAGLGRHTGLLLDMGFRVTAVDRDNVALLPLAGERCTVMQVDLESGEAWPLGSGYDFATPYLRFILGFIGIKNVTFIDAGRLQFEADKPEKARAEIAANLSAPLAEAA